MSKNVYFRKPLIITFPEDSDLYLKTLFGFGYYVFLQIPFKIVYDEKKRTYTARISHLGQVISLLRIAFILLQLSINNGLVAALSSPGPMKVFMAIFGFGRHFITFTFTVVMNLSRTRAWVVDLINLLSNNNMTDSIHSKKNNYAQQISRVLDTNFKGKQKKLFQFYVHYICLTYVVFKTSVLHSMSVGFKSGIRDMWNILASAFYPAGKVKLYREMTWWMKLGGFGVFLFEVDVACLFVSSILSVYLVAKTLNQISKHFIDHLESSQKYCSVTSNEIISNYRRVRKAFCLASAVFSQITFVVLFNLSVGTCVMTVLSFTAGFPLVTAFFEYYYFSTMKSAADASLKLRKIQKLFQFTSKQVSGKCSLQRALIMFELGSSSVGLTVSDVFVVTYAFVASVVVAMLSNATIVLQSLDMFKKTLSAPPTAVEE